MPAVYIWILLYVAFCTIMVPSVNKGSYTHSTKPACDLLHVVFTVWLGYDYRRIDENYVIWRKLFRQLINLFTTIHDGNFRRHSSMNVTIKWHKFSSNIYYIYVFFVIWSWKLRQQFQLQMTKNRTPTPVYLDPGMHPGLEVEGLKVLWNLALENNYSIKCFENKITFCNSICFFCNSSNFLLF